MSFRKRKIHNLNKFVFSFNCIEIIMKVKLNLIFHCALLYFLAFDIFHGNVLINELSVRQKNSSMV